jgi:hypothetical protein
MISLVSLFAVLGLLVLFGLFANIGRTTARKLETQNAADAVAHAAAVEMARGLNAVSAANHLIGEFAALCVIHHAFGGDELDEGRDPDDQGKLLEKSSDLAVDLSFAAAMAATPIPLPYQPARDAARQRLRAGAAIHDSRIQLRKVLVRAFELHAAAGAMQKFPLTAPAGAALAPICYAVELKVWQEWLVLDALELMARSTVPAKKAIQMVTVPGLQLYAHGAVAVAPGQMKTAADEIGARNAATGRVSPCVRNDFLSPGLKLPVVREPARPADWKKSQLVRATTPWVQSWRTPWLAFGLGTLTLSGFKHHYFDWTNTFTRTITDRLRREDVRLYVLPGWEPGRREKGTEDWTRADGSRQADELFCAVGFAHRPAARVTSFRIFRQANPDGMVAYAQGMAYGANPQTPNPGRQQQPRLGWDTLQWASPVREFDGGTDEGGYFNIPDAPEPRIGLNWQAKLVPTTRLVEAASWQTGALGTVIRRTPPWHMDLTGTH